MKKVFLDSLPHKGRLVDWMNSIGYKISFIYDDLQGELEIIGYDKIKHQCEILYNGNIVKIQTASLARGQISFAIGLKTHLYKHSIGQIVKTITGEIEITGYLKMYCSMRGYEYKCPKDGYVGKITEARLMDGVGCPVCSNKAVIKGINDIGTTNPEMVKYFKYKDDAYTHSCSSGKKVTMKCPICGYEKKIAIFSLSNGFPCICNDGISYPEKFTINLLKQLGVKFEYQKSNFKWSHNKIYDFYLPKLNCIIETHGKQHYSESNNFSNLNGRSLLEEQTNDKLKMELAKCNGIKHYIILDCRESTLEWLKNNILNSELTKLLDLSNINWNSCHEYACKNIVKEICDSWNKGVKNRSILSKQFALSEASISRYLKQGSELGWCNYHDMRFTKIICLNNLQIYNSFKDAIKNSGANGLQRSNITKCCKGKRRFAGILPDGTKLRWMYYNEYINLKK